MNLFGNYNRLVNISSGTWNIWLVHQQIISSQSLETQWVLQSEGLLLLISGMSLYLQANVTAFLFFSLSHKCSCRLASVDRELQR